MTRTAKPAIPNYYHIMKIYPPTAKYLNKIEKKCIMPIEKIIKIV